MELRPIFLPPSSEAHTCHVWPTVTPSLGEPWGGSGSTRHVCFLLELARSCISALGWAPNLLPDLGGDLSCIPAPSRPPGLCLCVLVIQHSIISSLSSHFLRAYYVLHVTQALRGDILKYTQSWTCWIRFRSRTKSIFF